MIRCTSCAVYKDLADFYVSTIHKNGFSGRCKECQLKKVKKYAQDNPEKRRALKLNANYNMTHQQYDYICTQQGGVCAICSSKTRAYLFVDHCHSTGVIRGLLCNSCNTLLGHAKDNINILCEAIKYLLKKGQ